MQQVSIHPRQSILILCMHLVLEFHRAAFAVFPAHVLLSGEKKKNLDRN